MRHFDKPNSKKEITGMKKKALLKTAAMLLVLAVCSFVILTSCNQSAGDSVTMTEYYAAGRQAYKNVTGVTLPEIADIGMNTADPGYADTLAYLKGITTETETMVFDLDIGISQSAIDSILQCLTAAYGNQDEGYPQTIAGETECLWQGTTVQYQFIYQVNDHIFLNVAPSGI